jgi:hypothetical protein
MVCWLVILVVVPYITILGVSRDASNVLLRHSPAAQLQQQQQQQAGAAAAMDRRLTVKIADFGLARHK